MECAVSHNFKKKICSKEEAEAADQMKDWSSAKNWAQWWTCSTHFKMLSVAFTELDIVTHGKGVPHQQMQLRGGIETASLILSL